MLTEKQLLDLELYLNEGCQVPNPVDFNSAHDIEALVSALDRLMESSKIMLLMIREERKRNDD